MKIRHNIRLILGSIIALTLVGVLLGSFQIRPIVFSETEMLPTITNNVEGTIDFFDHSVPHTVSLQVSDIAYDQMISDFVRFNEKTMVEADAVIDGTLIRSVGIRLKGNSTLGAIRRAANAAAEAAAAAESAAEPAAGEGESGSQSMPEGSAPDEVRASITTAEVNIDNNSSTDSTAVASSEAVAESTPAPNPLMIKMRSMMGGVTAEDPSTLPLLLSFDEFSPGRGYQGRTELSIRPVAGGGASLNEALSLQLITDSDQVSQKYTWINFNMNGGETRTRLVLENPNQNYASNLDLGRGVLYKSKNSNTFEYHGEDPILYVEDFLQLNAIGSHDLSPVIRFMAWIDTATSEEFDTDLSQWLDISSFAKYVVTQDLLDNFDDMAGPGRNFLFWYDLDDKKFTVINWDMNLAMIGVGDVFAGRFPGDASPADAPEQSAAEPAEQPATSSESSATDSTESPDDAPAVRPGPNLRPIMFGNTLKDRFVASEAYADEIEKARSDLLEFWFTSGHALDLLDTLSEYVPLSDHLSSEEINDQIASLTEMINSTK